MEDLRPELEDADDWDTVRELTGAALARGSSCERQRTRYAERGRVADVVQLLVDETSGRRPAPSRSRWSAGYAAPLNDEAVHSGGKPYAAYQPIFRVLERFDPAELTERARRMDSQGLTFGVSGEQRPFPVDPIPRVIPAHEWSVLAAGLTQRARALEAYLRDVHGPAAIVRDGVMAEETFTGL